MKEFIDKLIGKLEAEKNRTYFVKTSNPQMQHKYTYGEQSLFDAAIQIVNELSEEYEQTTDAGELLGKTEQVNEGWIPYTYKSYPKVGRIIDVWLTLEDGVYKAVWNGSDFEWENGRAVTDKVLAWMDNSVPKPYQPKEK